ncbi:MAG: hypothetical protein ACYS0I_01020 [Planctomycetota bacterium]|jgi:hypothetical protein
MLKKLKIKKKSKTGVVANVEQEYHNYISERWERLSDVTGDIFKDDQDLQDAYDTISQWSVEFLQDKLKSLETEES